MMNQEVQKNSFSGIFMLTLCAFIWGTAFIAQSVGGQVVEPLTFNFCRSFLATIFLFICCLMFDKAAGRKLSLLGTDDSAHKLRLIKGGLICGAALSLATFTQQVGILYTTVGKSGFITALYLVLVPVLNYLVFRKAISALQWLGVLIAAIGMYFICINESFSINKGDIYTLISAFCFAGQIIYVDKLIANMDGIRLSLTQLIGTTAINFTMMLLFENPTWASIEQGWMPIAYAGIMSSGIAYTLQIFGQKNCTPVLASMIMSLESAFALLSGWLLLGQEMTMREIFGCGLVFIAIILAQLPAEMLPWNRNKMKN